VTGRFSFDPVTSELFFDVHLGAPAVATAQAVVLRRADATGTRVIQRVLGPSMTVATGRVRLLGADLEAFRAGRLTMALFTSASDAPAAEVAVIAR
jgi:hypothetical protein